ncbi:hypothetical protein Herbaro_13520 [Herbaspirillum sp. WKF16]|jgi:hypothetical protein|uniref:hypothetical protein n=1 Tax=Herbaspirillum sp. WKF16 TaxID=3028312 RepID=UPI0023A988A7|nr:hypothetical protein [Herbaspirillum sp. WKF16]WDZ94512.1 hypothetical protein Herbaro_13520 [Herbaspirillum sp. WKF16]
MPAKSAIDYLSLPSFRPFTWHRANVLRTNQIVLAEHTHDIGNGIATLLALIEFHESEEQDDAPLLSPLDKGTLLRLAIASSCSYVQISKTNRAQLKKDAAGDS